jgi:copper chaperone
MTSVTYSVPNISCGHCVHTITRELGEIAGVSHVEASQTSRKVIVEFEPPATEEQIVASLTDINYPPAQ